MVSINVWQEAISGLSFRMGTEEFCRYDILPHNVGFSMDLDWFSFDIGFNLMMSMANPISKPNETNVVEVWHICLSLCTTAGWGVELCSCVQTVTMIDYTVSGKV